MGQMIYLLIVRLSPIFHWQHSLLIGLEDQLNGMLLPELVLQASFEWAKAEG